MESLTIEDMQIVARRARLDEAAGDDDAARLLWDWINGVIVAASWTNSQFYANSRRKTQRRNS